MPIFKFKSLFEAERALWNFKPDEIYVRRVAELWSFANRHRDKLELERAREIVNQSSKSS